MNSVRAAADLDRLLEELPHVEKFDPPEAFRAQARVRDPGVYEVAARDPETFWANEARALGQTIHDGAR